MNTQDIQRQPVPLAGSEKRREDPGLITGKTRFVDDIRLAAERPAVLSMLVVRSPYAHARLEKIEIEAARDLGARPLTVLSNIIVPRCRNGLVTAFAFSFLITAGDYVTPQMVGGKQTIIGNMIVQQFGEFFNWPLGSAMSFTMLVVALVVVAAVGGLLGRWGRP